MPRFGGRPPACRRDIPTGDEIRAGRSALGPCDVTDQQLPSAVPPVLRKPVPGQVSDVSPMIRTLSRRYPPCRCSRPASSGHCRLQRRAQRPYGQPLSRSSGGLAVHVLILSFQSPGAAWLVQPDRARPDDAPRLPFPPLSGIILSPLVSSVLLCFYFFSLPPFSPLSFSLPACAFFPFPSRCSPFLSLFPPSPSVRFLFSPFLLSPLSFQVPFFFPLSGQRGRAAPVDHRLMRAHALVADSIGKEVRTRRAHRRPS